MNGKLDSFDRHQGHYSHCLHCISCISSHLPHLYWLLLFMKILNIPHHNVSNPRQPIGTCSTRQIEILMMARSVWLVLSQFVTQLFSINIWVFNCHMYQYSPISLVRRALVLNNNSPNQITWRCGQGRPFSGEKFPKWKISTKKSEFRRFPSPKISDDLFQ